MRFKKPLMAWVALVAFAGSHAATANGSCYDGTTLKEIKAELPPAERQLMVVVDRTVDFMDSPEEIARFKKKVINFVAGALRPGDQLVLVPFGDLSGKNHAAESFNERMEPEVPQKLKSQVGRQDLKRLDSCLAKQHQKLQREFAESVEEAFENIGSFSRTPLFEALRVASTLINPEAGQASVLVVSDLMLHNDDLSFYRRGQLRPLDADATVNHPFVQEQLEQIDWHGADLYLLGVGNGVTETGDTMNLWRLMDTWVALAKASNAGKVIMGSADLPRQPANPRYVDNYIGAEQRSKCRAVLERHFPAYAQPQRQVIILLDQTLEVTDPAEAKHYLEQVQQYLTKAVKPGVQYSLVTFSQLSKTGYPEIKHEAINPRQVPDEVQRQLGRQDKQWVEWCLGQIHTNASYAFWSRLQSEWPEKGSTSAHSTHLAVLDFLRQHAADDLPVQVLLISDLMLNVPDLSLYRSREAEGLAVLNGEQPNALLSMAEQRLNLIGIEVLGLGVGVGAIGKGETRRLTTLRKTWQSFLERLNADVIALESRSIPQ